MAFPLIYAIVDAHLLECEESTFVRTLARAGIRLFQYRNKKDSSRRICDVSRRLSSVCEELGARLIVNDRVDIALTTGAVGVHVGQEDMDVEHVRRLCGSQFVIGISTHTLEQVTAGDLASVDYIAVGPIYATATKAETDPVVGPRFIQRARPLTARPLVAIGGITLENVNEVFEAGADAVALAGDLIRAKDPEGRAQSYISLAHEYRSSRDR